MENLQNETLDSGFISQNRFTRRRALLPWWIKTFAWIFMIFGVAAPLGLISGLLGFEFELSLYGLTTNYPLSLLGLIIIAIFSFKGLTAFALWTEKDWAISAGQIDAVLGIGVCSFVMIVLPFMGETNEGRTDGFRFLLSFRIELLFIIPYLIRLGKIKSKWNELTNTN